MNINPRAVFAEVFLLILISGVVVARAQPDGDSPAVSTVRIKLAGQTLVVTSHEAGTTYEIDGGQIKAVTPNSSMTFALSGGKILIGGGDTKMEVPEVRITRGGQTAFVGRIEGGPAISSPPFEPEAGEPFADAEEPAPVRVQPRPAEASAFRVQPGNKQ